MCMQVDASVGFEACENESCIATLAYTDSNLLKNYIMTPSHRFKLPGLLLAALIGIFLLQSCASTQSEETSIEVSLTSDGPYFAGANSFMNDFSVDLSALVSSKALQVEDIASVKLSKASIELPDGEELSFDQFNSASLQLVSDDAPMTSFAIVNPIPEGASGAIDMVVSESAEATDFFKQQSFTILLDLDFKEDDYRDQMSVTTRLTFNVEHK